MNDHWKAFFVSKMVGYGITFAHAVKEVNSFNALHDDIHAFTMCVIRMCRANKGATIARLAEDFGSLLGYAGNTICSRRRISRIVNHGTGYPYAVNRTHSLPA